MLGKLILCSAGELVPSGKAGMRRASVMAHDMRLCDFVATDDIRSGFLGVGVWFRIGLNWILSCMLFGHTIENVFV